MQYKRLLFTVVFCHTICTQIFVLLRNVLYGVLSVERVFLRVTTILEFLPSSFSVSFITLLQPLTRPDYASLRLAIQFFRLSSWSLPQIIFTVSGILVTCPRNRWVCSSFMFDTLPEHLVIFSLPASRYQIKQPAYNFQFFNDIVFFSICFVSVDVIIVV